MPRQQRNCYFNDARHYYLFAVEPPMRLQDAWRPIDEVAGTGVSTFIYGASRDDGLFYPSEVGLPFRSDTPIETELAAYWRVKENMRSLQEAGHDPLGVLIDRAHEKGMEFFCSMRMGALPGFTRPELLASSTQAVSGSSPGGRGYVHREVRDHQLAVLTELANMYPTMEGIELDFAASPGGSGLLFRDGEGNDHSNMMNSYVSDISAMVHSGGGLLGARVFPTEAMNLRMGLDVKTWLIEGLLDYVVPMFYLDFVLDCNLPIQWLTTTSHDCSVYPMLQPYYDSEEVGRRLLPTTHHCTLPQFRAAAANLWAAGADGLYTWFLQWPLQPQDRAILTELSDPELLIEKDKHYFIRRRQNLLPPPEGVLDGNVPFDYESFLPIEVSHGDASHFEIPFNIADDCSNPQVDGVLLRLAVVNLVTADVVELLLNGKSLSIERSTRRQLGQHVPYEGQWVEVELHEVRPQQGENTLSFCLSGRPAGLECGVVLEYLEILVSYTLFPQVSLGQSRL